MIITGERYSRFSIGLANGEKFTTEETSRIFPTSAVYMSDHIQVTWSDGDIGLYPMHVVVAFIVHGLANTTKEQQP